jgi:hypothetical protein
MQMTTVLFYMDVTGELVLGSEEREAEYTNSNPEMSEDYNSEA